MALMAEIACETKYPGIAGVSAIEAVGLSLPQESSALVMTLLVRATQECWELKLWLGYALPWAVHVLVP